MATRWITRACIATFVCGIAGLIISSIAGNNNGVVLTIGAVIGAAVLTLLVTSTVTSRERIDTFVEADAERLEEQIVSLVRSGADETAVRTLVRDALRLERR
jgi:protein-L-isoaspartate O-methyltransferase